MPQDERGYLILPHELATGADCDGCLIVVERGDMWRSSATLAARWSIRFLLNAPVHG
jgi:hypothetical protein